MYAITSGCVNGAKKVVVYGPEGIGKTSFAANFPDPVFVDTEDSTKAYNVRRFPRPNSFAMLLAEVQQVRDTPGVCRTLVVDTADWAERLCTQDLLSRTKKGGIEDFGYGKGYVYLSEDFGKLLNLLDEVISRGVNVVLTAHAKLSKFEQPDEMGSYDRWEMKLSKHIFPMVKEWADIILFANYKTLVIHTDDGKKAKAQGGARVMYTTHHACWDAKNRYDLPQELPLDFASIAHLFAGANSASVNTAAAPATTAAPAVPRPRNIEAQASPAPAAPAASPDDVNVTKRVLQLEGIEPRLAQLMAAANVSESELRSVVGGKGYFPADMPVKDYPADFIAGWCIPHWQKIVEVVENDRSDLPF